MNFIPGDLIEKTFFLEDENGDAVDISELSGVLYETKTPTRIVHTFLHGTATAPTQVDAKHVKFTFSPEITRKCRKEVNYTFDVYVGSKQKIYTGDFGEAGFSPLTEILA